MANAFAMLPIVVTPSANSTAAGYDAANMANDHAGVVWKSNTGVGTISIVADCGMPHRIDTALFFGCTNASAAWTLSVQSADDAAFTVNPTVHVSGAPFLAGANFPTHGRGVGYWTTDAVLPPRRYWRFLIGGHAGAAITVARLAIGRRLTLERNFGFGGAWGVRDLGAVDFSTTGNRLRRRAVKLRVLGLTFPAVRKDEALTKVQPLVELAAGQEPIVLVTDPAVSADRQKCCYFGHLTGELGQVWRSAVAFEWRANMIDLIPIPAGITTPGTPIFDFSGGVLPSGVTFARASTGTYYNAAGAVASAAVDAPRFDYDPATLLRRGILIEPAATNTGINSADFSAFTALNATVTVNDRVAPDGTTTADKVVVTGAGNRIQRFDGTTQNAQYAHGMWVYCASPVTGSVVCYDSGASTSTPFSVPANTWTRVEGTRFFTGADRRPWIEFAGTPTVWLWGWQIEAGSALSSYIPTTGATATRAADVLTLPWGAMGVADGAWTIRYTFDDGSTQDVVTTIASGVANVPTNLNRRWLRSAEKI